MRNKFTPHVHFGVTRPAQNTQKWQKLLLSLIFVKLLYFAEPSQSATISKVTVLNSTSVRLEWKPVPEQFRHGIIIKYVIGYRDEDKKTESKMVIPQEALKAIVNGLRQSAEYSFWIWAATSKGTSPPSDTKKVTTEGETF